MKKNYVLAGLSVVSIVLYLVDYFLLGNVRDIAASFIGNLAFLPVYVIFVTLMIEQIMREHERQVVLRKLNMVIGVFFSEVGNHLLRELSRLVVTRDELREHLMVKGTWKADDYQRALAFLSQRDVSFATTADARINVRAFLVSRRGFLVGLLENQSLLEHDQFTDLLWSVFHLVEELEARTDFTGMPQSDIDHLHGDMKRVFGHLSREWLLYMQHLNQDYPYLFSLAVRLNPMIDQPNPQV